MGECCDPKAPKLFKLFVSGFQVGLVGAEQAFFDVRSLSLTDKESAEKLMEIVKRRNYIPQGAEKEYKIALLAEYHKFLARSSCTNGKD